MLPDLAQLTAAELLAHHAQVGEELRASGVRYQIKGRQVTQRNSSRQLGGLRDLAGRLFDVLAGVIFDDDFRVVRAALIPHDVVEERSTYSAHTNSHKFFLCR